MSTFASLNYVITHFQWGHRNFLFEHHVTVTVGMFTKFVHCAGAHELRPYYSLHDCIVYVKSFTYSLWSLNGNFSIYIWIKEEAQRVCFQSSLIQVIYTLCQPQSVETFSVSYTHIAHASSTPLLHAFDIAFITNKLSLMLRFFLHPTLQSVRFSSTFWYSFMYISLFMMLLSTILQKTPLWELSESLKSALEYIFFVKQKVLVGGFGGFLSSSNCNPFISIFFVFFCFSLLNHLTIGWYDHWLGDFYF